MGTTVFEGRVIELRLNGEILLALDMPRKPEKAKTSFLIDSIFHSFLGKKVKITVEEIKE